MATDKELETIIEKVKEVQFTPIMELLRTQGEIIATLSVRISVLENLIIKNNLLNLEDLIRETEILSIEFYNKINEAKKGM